MKFRAFYELPQISVYMYIFLVGSTTGFSVVANGAIIGVTHLKTSSYTHAWTHTHTHARTHAHARMHAHTDAHARTLTDFCHSNRLMNRGVGHINRLIVKETI